MSELSEDRQAAAACFCYVTAGSSQETLRIGRALVEERLAAAANVVDGLPSLYWWQGTLEQASEALLILKTRVDLVPALTARVRQLHRYACPCVVALPIAAGHPDYLDWIAAETRPAAPPSAGAADAALVRGATVDRPEEGVCSPR